MDDQQRVAFVMAQIACMQVEMEAMKIANFERIDNGLSPAYGEAAFRALIEQYGLGHNSALTALRGG